MCIKMTNKLIRLLKENSVGAIFGGIIAVLSPTIIQINLLLSMTGESVSSPLLGIIISFTLGALIGAFF